MIKKFMLLIIFLCGLAQAYAQDRVITGKVVDETGTTLPGATVSIKGTTKATATDIDGKYSIKVPAEGGILVFTYVGYTTQEMTISTSDVIDVNMTSSVKSLDEIVVV
jgi:TonB-dependent starch-binding outer membrane protein SusC